MKSNLKKIKINKEGFGSINFKINDNDYEKIIKTINIQIGFEELLKLRLALDSAALELNRYNKGQLRARGTGVNFFMFVNESVKSGKNGRMTITIS